MPLIQGCSVISAKANYSRLMKEGYFPKQAYAISLKIARENMRMCDIHRREALRRGELFNRRPRYER